MKFMKIILPIILALFFSVCLTGLNAQDSVTGTSTMVPQTADKSKTKMNIIKVNLLSPFFKNISFQYERVINQLVSVTLTARYMPNSSLPYSGLVYNMSGSTDPATEDAIKSIKMSNYSISPEVRFYPGKKGYGRGFYVGVSYRYSYFKLNDMNYIYNNYPAPDSAINFSGSLNAHYGGVLLGVQWFLGKHFTLDWWFFGPLIGYEKSSMAGATNVPLSQEDQDDLRDFLENDFFPNANKTVYVDQYGATVDMKGLMYGMNFGLALGFRF